MKNWLAVVLVFVAFVVGNAQTLVTIAGQVENHDTARTIYLGIGDEILEPLSILPDGSFLIRTTVPELPTFVTFNTISKRGKIESQLPRIWFQDDSIHVNINLGTRTFLFENRLSFQSISEELESLTGAKLVSYVLQNQEYYPSLYFAYWHKEEFPLSDLENFLLHVPPQLRATMLAQRLGSFIQAKRAGIINVGSQLTQLTLPDKDNRPRTIAVASAKKRLVVLLSSGCAFSIASIQQLSDWNKRYGEKLELVTIWTDGNKSTWLNSHAPEKSKINWLNLWDESGFAKTYFGLTGWPSFYVLKENGILTHQFNNSKAVERKLSELLN
jgi:hypothetical protein